MLSFAGIDLPASPLGAMTVGILGLVSAASVWLAFLPPAAYLRWVAARGRFDDRWPRPGSGLSGATPDQRGHRQHASASQPGQSPSRA